jgi:hypothetical protein
LSHGHHVIPQSTSASAAGCGLTEAVRADSHGKYKFTSCGSGWITVVVPSPPPGQTTVAVGVADGVADGVGVGVDVRGMGLDAQ